MIKWIFFDVGSVIFYDLPAMVMTYEKLYYEIRKKYPGLTFEDLLKEREKIILTNKSGNHHWIIGEKYLGKDSWLRLRDEIIKELENNYLKYNYPIKGIDNVLETLSSEYNLGLGANQVLACRKALEHFGLSKYFKVYGLSDEVGIYKPDIKFFEFLLKEAKCKGEEAIMVGDRIDFDIAPAKALGFKTIWIKMDFSNMNHSDDKFYKAYIESYKRVNLLSIKPKNENEKSDYMTYEIDNIIKGVKYIDSIKRYS